MERGARRRGPGAIVALLVVLLGAAGLALWLAVVAVGRGWADGPEVSLRLGDYYLIARTTTRPECLPLTQHECFVSFPTPPAAVPPYFTVWAGRIVRLPGAGPGSAVTVSSGRQLLRLPVVREAVAPPGR
jgi:hypothetical protein